MLTLRDRDLRGPTKTGWLDSKHSFSFGQYYDPEHMGFGPLRVINEDWVIPGGGFPTHPHQNMEILTYVLEGAVAHKDSMGNGSTIRPGEIQMMSAGSGVTHSEFNHSDRDTLHLLQIWLMPNVTQTQPGYQQRKIDPGKVQGKFGLLASPDGDGDSLVIKQDARVLLGKFAAASPYRFEPEAGRRYWVQLAKGIAQVNGLPMRAGDGLAVTGEKTLEIENETDTEILLFDLP